MIENIREVTGGDDDAFRRLEELIDEHGEEITPDQVVEDAVPETSPLHRHFEWDDSVAGPAYRRIQARTLIQSYRLHIVDADGERRVRYYTNVIIEDEHRYKRTEDVLRVAGLREQRRLKIIHELNRIRSELTVWDALAGALTGIDAALTALAGQAPEAEVKK